MNPPISPSASRSWTICSRTPGRCTLTATRRPLRSCARWTWPSDAAASGVGSNSAKALEMRTPSSSATIRSTSVNENGSTLSCRRASAVKEAGGGRSGRVERSWPSLTNVGPSCSRSSARLLASATTSGSWALSSPSTPSIPAARTRSDRPCLTSSQAMSLYRFRCWGFGSMCFQCTYGSKRASGPGASPARALVPLVDLLAGGHPHALLLPDVVVDGLEVLDPVRHAGVVGMDGQRHHARLMRALGIQAIEVIDAAAEPLVRRVMLDDHHRDVVQLDRVRHRHERPVQIGRAHV